MSTTTNVLIRALRSTCPSEGHWDEGGADIVARQWERDVNEIALAMVDHDLFTDAEAQDFLNAVKS